MSLPPICLSRCWNWRIRESLFLGVKKPVVKAHGSSDAKLFEYTLKQAEQFVNDKTVDNIIEKYSELNNESQKTETISAE